MNIIYRRLDWLYAQALFFFILSCPSLTAAAPASLPPHPFSFPLPSTSYLSSISSVHPAWLLPFSLFLPLCTVCFICCKSFSSVCPILMCYTALLVWLAQESRYNAFSSIPQSHQKIITWNQLLSSWMLTKKDPCARNFIREILKSRLVHPHIRLNTAFIKMENSLSLK